MSGIYFDIQFWLDLENSEDGTDVDPTDIDDVELLHTAAQMGNLRTVEDLLKYGADVNIKDQRGYTLLHSAVECGRVEMTQLLIYYGADVNARNNVGKTPIFLACRGINFLPPHKGHEQVNPRNMSPLFAADDSVDLRIVKILLNFGADINSIDKSGTPPLHWASMRLQPEITTALLQNGADINIICKDGYTALHYVDVDVIVSKPRSVSRTTLRMIETGESLVQHVVKMKAKSLFVSEKILQRIEKNSKLKKHYNCCESEIKKMKNEKIGNTKIYFYDMLLKDVHQLAKYSRNENIVETMESSDYRTMFPRYANTIHNQFKKAQEREDLLKSCMKSLNFLSGYELPYIVANEMFSYLSNLDLKHLIVARPDVSGDER